MRIIYTTIGFSNKNMRNLIIFIRNPNFLYILNSITRFFMDFTNKGFSGFSLFSFPPPESLYCPIFSFRNMIISPSEKINHTPRGFARIFFIKSIESRIITFFVDNFFVHIIIDNQISLQFQ